MSLNLKNPRAYELASQLAALTGESLTAAVIRALEMRLEQEQQRKGKKTTAERMLAFADRFSRGMPAGCTSAEHASLLYGDDGLPR
jgi:antitoxin VapB